MRESVAHLAMLKVELASLAAGGSLRAHGRIAIGHDAFDTALGGGLARGRVHELFAADSDDEPSMVGLAALLALKAADRGDSILWLRTDRDERLSGRLQGAGFAELGGDPGALILGTLPDAKALLKGAADAARCGGLKALVVECRGKCAGLDLTASRRLALAAEQSGVTLFLLRPGTEPSASAADTRWAVAAASSRALETNAPGAPAFEMELLRRRSGPAGMRWRLEWNRDRLIFTDPTLPGAVVPLSSRRPVAPNNSRDSGMRLSA